MFEELPVEIIECIVSQLPDDDLLQFRQTSTKLYQKSNDFCARKLFHTISTDLSFEELQWLSTSFIANVQLAVAVRTIVVRVKKEGRPLGHDYYWNRTVRGGALTLPCDGFEALRTLTSHLPQCKSFRIQAADRQSDIDGPDDLLEPADVVQLILLLASEDGIQFDTIEIAKDFGCEVKDPDGIHVRDPRGTHLNPERLPVATLKDSNVRTMLANLQRLTLNLVYSDGLVGTHWEGTGWLWIVFGALRHLKALDLSLDMARGDTEVIENLVSELQLPKLQELRLCSMRFEEAKLDAFLSPCRHTLRTLKLTGIGLVSSSPPRQATWKEWLDRIKDSHSGLRYLELDNVNTCNTTVRLEFMPFYQFLVLDDIDDPSDLVVHQRYPCVVPDPLDAHLASLVMHVMTRGWIRDDRPILTGIRYEGDEMHRAIEFIHHYATETRTF